MERTYYSLDEVENHLRGLPRNQVEAALTTCFGHRIYRRHYNGVEMGGWLAINVQLIVDQQAHLPTIGAGVIVHGPSQIYGHSKLIGRTSIPPYSTIGSCDNRSYTHLENVILRGDLNPASIQRSQIGGNGHIILEHLNLGEHASITVENGGEVRISHKKAQTPCRIAGGIKIHANGGRVYLADFNKSSPRDSLFYHIPAGFNCNVGPEGCVLMKYTQLSSCGMTLGQSASPIHGSLYISRCSFYQQYGVAIYLGKNSCIGLIDSHLRLPSVMKTWGIAEGDALNAPGGIIYIERAMQANNVPVTIYNDMDVDKGAIVCYGQREIPWHQDIQGFRLNDTLDNPDCFDPRQSMVIRPIPINSDSLWHISEGCIISDGVRQFIRDPESLRYGIYRKLRDIAATRMDHHRAVDRREPLEAPPSAPAALRSYPSRSSQSGQWRLTDLLGGNKDKRGK